MTPTGHINQAAERAFWLGPVSHSNSNVTERHPAVASVASRPDRLELPSEGPAGECSALLRAAD